MERGLKRNRSLKNDSNLQGQKYVQNKEVAKKQHNELTYRGKAYTS